MSNLPKPKYSIWQALATCLALSMRAIEEVRALAREPGPKGDPGERGMPGFGFDDFQIKHDGERTITFIWARGDDREERSFVIPAMIYRGVFKEGQAYTRGDVVTWGGSAWHANEDTTGKPGISKDWTLAVKQGRDGNGPARR